MGISGAHWGCVILKCHLEKQQKEGKQCENTAPTILASELLYCSLEIKAMP